MKRIGAVGFGMVAMVMLTGARDVRGSTWRNPSNSVHLRFEACGKALCGKVVWANAKARTDARRGSGSELIGTPIFRDLRPAGKDAWQGRVFVPDLNVSFDGTVTRQGNNRLVGEGCLLGRIGCRSQVWTRVSG